MDVMFKEGKWYYDENIDEYFMVSSVYNNHYKRRYAGQDEQYMDMLSIPLDDTKGIVPASITPDVNSFKQGDKCFSPLEGETTVVCNLKHRVTTTYGTHSKHCAFPPIFERQSQFLAYHLEMKLNQDKRKQK